MPMPPPSASGMSGPSTIDKLKMGAMMGGTVGVIIGFIFGATNIMRYGAGPNGVMRSLGQYMVGSGTTFAFFMGIGSTIRTDSGTNVQDELYATARRHPFLMPRQSSRRSQSS